MTKNYLKLFPMTRNYLKLFPVLVTTHSVWLRVYTYYTAHPKALHIPPSNLPVLTAQYAMTLDASGNATYTNSPRGILIIPNRTNEEIKNLLDLNAASTAWVYTVTSQHGASTAPNRTRLHLSYPR